jgi:dCTP deaminase
MPLSAIEIAKHLDKKDLSEDKWFVLAPSPNPDTVRKQGAASIDLRLGTWFVTTKASHHSLLDIYSDSSDQPSEHSITNKHYVPLGGSFILHPNSFVLAASLEWVKMPRGLCGYVTGKSSWGRRGLIIETAPGVHPGFAGCLTLELANVGELPIKLVTGTNICQLFLHKIIGDQSKVDQSSFLGQRQPKLGKIDPGDFIRSLMKSSSNKIDNNRHAKTRNDIRNK